MMICMVSPLVIDTRRNATHCKNNANDSRQTKERVNQANASANTDDSQANKTQETEESREEVLHFQTS